MTGRTISEMRERDGQRKSVCVKERERERERESDQRERVNKREIMTRPRPTSFCVPLVKRVHTVTDTQAQAGVGGMVSDKSERKRERERERIGNRELASQRESAMEGREKRARGEVF